MKRLILIAVFLLVAPLLSFGQQGNYQLFFVSNSEFENNLGGWSAVYGFRSDGIPVSRGTAEWSSNFGGSAYLKAQGSPGGVSLINFSNNVLFPGDKIVVGLYHKDFPNGVSAGFALYGGKWGEQASTVREAPEEDIELEVTVRQFHLPGTPIVIYISCWPGGGEAWFKYVKLIRGGIVDWTAVSNKNNPTPNLPESPTLFQNYPNPFNPSTNISYSLPTKSRVQLDIYDSLGRHVKTLINQVQSPGEYQVIWDGTNEAGEKVASGNYFYVVKAGDSVQARKAIFLK